jgi:fatty acid desaturase
VNVFGLTVDPWVVFLISFAWAWLSAALSAKGEPGEGLAYTIFAAVILVVLLCVGLGAATIVTTIRGG